MENNLIPDFINANRDFWRSAQEPDTDQLRSDDSSYNPVINHGNAVVAKMIARAHGLRIGWIRQPFTDELLIRSYSASSVFLTVKKPSLLKRARFILLAIWYYVTYCLLVKRTLSFVYKGVPYGDFVYDGYLARYSMATLHRFDCRLSRVFYSLLVNDDQARSLLEDNSIKAVLVAHFMGMDTGPLSRVAMFNKIPLYWKGGGHGIFNLAVFRNLEERYNYPHKPTVAEVDALAYSHKEEIEDDFKNFIEQSKKATFGVFTVAYNNTLHSQVSRESFLKDLALEDKPLIFVMLHAFNDHPHSHFRAMLFADYYDWFRSTLRFALKDTSKNWIFKEHPANRFYRTGDIDLNKIMGHLPGHVKFIRQDSVIRASTVLNVADAIITCLGSAGVEMPALARIPSVIASDTFYDRLGFAIEPSSKQEYFKVIKNLAPGLISPEKQLRAKCSYLFLNKYCMMPFSAGPALTLDEIMDHKKTAATYYERVAKIYKEKAAVIRQEFDEYALEIAKCDFVRLIRSPLTKEKMVITERMPA